MLAMLYISRFLHLLFLFHNTKQIYFPTSSRWQQCDGNSFGNEIYNIEFRCDKTNPPIFGAKYNFQLEGVVNCPEFLVYLPVFRKLALKFDLELILFER